ncbi:MAG TPA: carboxypeptidase-like regulatory domain-containing protein, partial [Thermoanaerobaculia bacterium]|nr:carboxypeptidase-like regulatory domain-containing protein [Thermoanaerobaculia bacterium]
MHRCVCAALLALLAAVAAADGVEELRFGTGDGLATVSLLFDVPRVSAGSGTLILAGDGEVLRRQVSVAQLGAVRRLVVPAGRYELSMALPHFRPLRRTIDASRDVALGIMHLEALPVIRGRVVPVAGARVAIEGREPVRVGTDGSFAVEVDGAWPRDLVVSAPGRGTIVADVPAVAADVTLPPIKLGEAGEVRVTVERNGTGVPLEVVLGLTRDDAESRWLQSRKLTADQSQTVFAGVARGVYDVLVRGPQPLQRASYRVVLGSGDRRSVRVPVSWSFVRMRVAVGDAPLPGARVRFIDGGGRWSTELTTDASGEAQSAAWMSGRFRVLIDGGGLTTPYTTRAVLDDKPIQVLAFVVPQGRVVGLVVDGEGGAVAGADVSLRSEGRDARPTVRTRTNAEGRFVITGVRAGAQTLRVDAEGLLRPDAVRFELGEDEHSRTIDVVARGGRRVAFAVRDGHGAPLGGALVVAASEEGRVRSTARSDSRGAGAILLPAGERGTAYVFPHDGSLAARRIEPADDVLRIIVPPPNATLRVATLA